MMASGDSMAIQPRMVGLTPPRALTAKKALSSASLLAISSATMPVSSTPDAM
jgi:hypothetical protein